MSREVVVAGAAFIAMYLLVEENEDENKPRRRRRWWKTQLYKKRAGSELMIDLKSQELSGQYKNFTRMSPIDFEYLITLVGAKVGKYDTPMRAAISVQDRLALTVRFLATGDSYTSLQYIFRISKQSISLIVPEVCLAIIEAIKENIRVPTTPAGWKEISKKFEELWNFPHCIGSMDGKHVIIDAPIHSGTEYRNYKSFFSIVMFAVVDAEYNFLFVDAGCQGRISDGGVFKDTIFFQKIGS
ncbi:unnamed protein product [Acanthoscelides obtectus]|uniref:DDE Tnp4 domain-containing protein n=1 Tax=Acanthoscelides obtectus TaxID=200917 RepID=A0A9P0PVH3_ACAOB|nr:unnamed protein product [Acanthoscelides obtectus]CAK1656838.1 Protein ALP1-like [Acanthoscelides obtectus]